jgi:hypothetical protein
MVLAPKGRHARQPSRQARAAWLAAVAVIIPLLAALVLSTGELARHGYAFFAFRPAGTGATRADAPPFPSSAPSLPRLAVLVPEAPQAYVMYVLPGLAHRRSMTVTMTVIPGELIFVTARVPPAVKR